MYKSSKKGFKQVIDVLDFYSCATYDFLWGDGLYKIAMRVRKKRRRMNWHEKIAYTLGEYLPPRIGMLPLYFKIRFMNRKTRKLIEDYLINTTP